MSAPERILVIGYFGFDNAGDEAILHSVVSGLHELRPGARCIVTSGDPAATRRLHHVDAILWNDIGALVEAARQVKLIAVGGGGLFQDHWGFDPESLLSRAYSGIAFFSTAALLSNLLEKPLVILGVGVGPLYSAEAKAYTRMVFDQAVAATVRDPESRELVLSLGVEPDRVRLTADPAFLLSAPGPDEAAAVLRLHGVEVEGETLVGVALREWDLAAEPEVWEAEVAKALDGFARHHDARILFLPFQVIPEYLSNDLAVARRIRDRMEQGERAVILDSASSPRQKAAALAACRVVLAMRLHAVLFSAKVGRPVVALRYDQKVEYTMRQLGWEKQCLDLGSVTARGLERALDDAVTHRRELEGLAAAAVAELEERALENNRLLNELLSVESPPPRAESAELLRALRRTALARAVDADTQQRLVQVLRTETAALNAQMETLRTEQQLLAAERRALLLERNQLREEEARSRELLHRLTHTKSVALANVHWRLRRRLNGLLSAVSRAGRVSSSSMAGRLSGRMKRLFPKTRVMSYYAYAFDSYKRFRMSRYEPDLRSVACPSEGGLVSIVLPVYNGSPMVTEALDSILAQTYRNFELICINDGSTDDTGEILERYAASDERVKVIHQENLKIPRTLSRGFSLARGEYLTWTSADNRLKPTFLERMVDCLERHPEWDMTYANLDIIGEDGLPLLDSEWYRGYQVPDGSEHVHLPTDVSELNVWPNNYVGAAFLYRDRVAWLLGDYSRHRFTTEDYDYWMRVNDFLTLRHTDFPEPVYEYRFHGRSLTARDAELGITRSRIKLMVFDDFRRDFVLSPALWHLDPGDGSAAQDLARRLRQKIETAGHRLAVQGELEAGHRLPRLWLPAVYLRIVDRPESLGAPPNDLPGEPVRVGVVAGSDPLPVEADAGWDLCVAAGSPSAPLPRLPGHYRGWLAVGTPELLFSVLDIRAKARQLELVEEETELPVEPELRASVVICTCWRGERLAQAVASVAQQTFPPDDYEILVVNNKTEDELLQRQIEELRDTHFAGREDRFRLILCPLAGLSHARNAAISEARGRVVCFLDDDAIAREDWLEEVCRVFDHHLDVGVVGGPIVLKPPEPPPAVLNPGWHRYWSQFLTGYTRPTKVQHWWEFPWGANWSARRPALVEIGGFRTRYGRRGADFSGGEEIVAASLIQRLGYSVAIAPAAEVLHDVEPSRYTFRHVRRTITAGTIISYQAQRDLYLPMESSPWLTLRRLLNPAVDRTVEASGGLSRVRHWLYRRGAWLRLLVTQLRDLRCRMRRPVGRT